MILICTKEDPHSSIGLASADEAQHPDAEYIGEGKIRGDVVHNYRCPNCSCKWNLRAREDEFAKTVAMNMSM